jgi:hypothetical protein
MVPARVIAAGALLCLASASGEKLMGGNFSLEGAITGGGGLTRGGSFSLLGEIARPIAGESRNGSFSLQTFPFDFYSIPLGDFELDIILSGSFVTLNWPSAAGAYTLESASALGQNALWETVPGSAGTNSISVQAQGSAQFFRLRAPAL